MQNKKKLYLIPGWQDTCLLEPYQKILGLAKNIGYEVITIDVDWKKTLSSQIFSVEENTVIFGFSLGAILAWLVAQKYEISHLILASMTPHYSFSDPEIKQALIDLAGVDFVEDIIKNLGLHTKAKKQTIMYGDQEGEAADILVFDTDHELNNNYINEILKII